MNPLRQIFDAVVDLTPQEREQYLAEHPPGPELRAQLERMLRADATLRCAADDSDRALSWSRALETQNAILPSGSSMLERRAQIALEMQDAATAAATLEQLARVLAGIEQQRPYRPGRLDALRGELALLRGEAEAAGSMLASAVSAVDRSTYPGRLLAVQIALLQAQAARARGQADEDHLLRAAREAEGVQHLPARIAAQLGGAHTAR